MFWTRCNPNSDSDVGIMDLTHTAATLLLKCRFSKAQHMRTLIFLMVLTLATPALAGEPLRTLRGTRTIRVSNSLRTRADLSVLAMGRPNGAPNSCLGTANKVLVQVANRGGVATRPTKVHLQVIASKPGVRSIAYTKVLSLPRVVGGGVRSIVFPNVRYPDGSHAVELRVKVDPDGLVAESSETNNDKRERFDVRNMSTCGTRAGVRQIAPKLDIIIDRVTDKTTAEVRSRKCLPRVGVTVRNRTGAAGGRPTVVVTMKQRGVTGAPTHTKRVRLATPLRRGSKQEVLLSFDRHALFNGLRDNRGVMDTITYDVTTVVIADPQYPETKRDNNRVTKRINASRFLGTKPNMPQSRKNAFTRRCAVR